MNIQVSVILWTVICFLALMLILQKLLFAPMFKCMDAREKRVADARARHRQNEEISASAQKAAENAAREANEQAKKDAERIIAEEGARAETELSACRDEEKKACEQYAAALCAEREEFSRQTADVAEALSEVFVAGFFR